MKPKQIPEVPAQKKGGFHDSESTRSFTAADIDSKFDILKERFFSINQWKDYAGKASADFKHFDSSGLPVARIPQKGDLIRIAIPGPGTREAKGYDWVEIVNIFHKNTNTSEYHMLMCRPSRDPDHPKGHIAHFYRPSATSNIMILKENNVLKAGIYGRNERPNLNAAFLDRIRNFFIGLGGIFGFSKIQWKILAEGLLDFK